MKTTLQELDDKYLVTFDGDLDTAAAVVSILRGATDGGYSVTLRHVNEEIKMVFNMTGFIKIFNFE